MATRKIASKTATKTAAKAASKAPGRSAARQETKSQATPAAAPRKPAAPAAATLQPALREKAAAVRPAPVPNGKVPSAAAQVPTGETRYRWVAHAAYLRAERRGFAPGHEVEDWLAAEAEFLAAHGLNAD